MKDLLNNRSHIILLKDVWLVPSTELATNVDEFRSKAQFFKQGTLFTDDWTEEEKNSKPAPNYGWMYISSSQDGGYKFAHFHKELLNNWSKHPDLFREF